MDDRTKRHVDHTPDRPRACPNCQRTMCLKPRLNHDKGLFVWKCWPKDGGCGCCYSLTLVEPASMEFDRDVLNLGDPSKKVSEPAPATV